MSGPPTAPIKRTIDIIVSAVGLVVLAPAIVLLAAVSAATYRAWPFFTHERVGMGGRTFKFTKIRSLPPTISSYTDKYELSFSRVPVHMALMRRLHLDEMPQLLHVFRGQMSLVGPRPEMPFLFERLPAEAIAARVRVRPGITGLWQVSPHCQLLICERPEYDRLYVEYQGVALDLWILFATFKKIVLRRTTQLHDVPAWVLGRPPVPAIARPQLDLAGAPAVIHLDHGVETPDGIGTSEVPATSMAAVAAPSVGS